MILGTAPGGPGDLTPSPLATRLACSRTARVSSASTPDGHAYPSDGMGQPNSRASIRADPASESRLPAW